MKNKDFLVIILAAGDSKRMKQLTRDLPKSFLKIRDKKLIEYHLDTLNSFGYKDIVMVVGYCKELFKKSIGANYKNLSITYVESDVYSTTGHSWSLYITKPIWERKKRPVLLVHADLFYDPNILKLLTSSSFKNLIPVDHNYKVQTGDECIVTGQNGRIANITFNLSDGYNHDIAGEFIGINKWSKEFMGEFYAHLESYIEEKGNKFSYEIVLNNFINTTKNVLNYIEVGKLSWININYKEDYLKAKDELFFMRNN